MNYLKICVIILIIGLFSVICILCILLNKNKCGVKSRDLLSCPKLSCPKLLSSSSNIESDISTSICPPSALKNNQEINDPEIKKFKKYLEEKMRLALQTYVKSGGGSNSPNYLSPNSNFGIGIYIKNTPGNRGPVKTFYNYQGSVVENTTKSDIEEKSYYFGSGTKPLTAAMVVGQLYSTWKNKNPLASVSEFIKWYVGSLHQPGAPPAVTYSDLFNMTNGFEESNFTETITQPSNTQLPATGKANTQKIQDWLFCCDKKGLSKNCSMNGIFCDDTCTNLCPISLDNSTYGGKCQSPFCPTSICDWEWYSDYKKTPATLDANQIPFQKGKSCTCEIVQPSEYQNILQNLSVYNVTMMRSGIADSDSIWGIDTSAQLNSRTNSIGPVQFVSEIIGFDWNPLWKKAHVKENYQPVTKSLDGVYPCVGKNNTCKVASTYPAAQYSSSSYTFLGILLWLLTKSNGKKNWSEIDLNKLLPVPLQGLINFAGTKGNSGQKYFSIDKNGNEYYSFETTVDCGNIPHPGVVHSSPSPISSDQTDLTGIKGSVYLRDIITNNNGSSTKMQFVDWDSSSGLSCGNGWGKCSDMAEIYMNILSPNADYPIVGNKELQKSFCEQFINYNGKNWEKLWNNKIRAPWCVGANAWSQDMTYNCGVMGPDWFLITNVKDQNNNNNGYIPCYGHLGDTYGYQSGHIYFPGGKIKAYKPWRNDYSSYNNPNWNMTFDFCGGSEFTISQAHNNDNDDQSGAIQHFIWELVSDPFKWTST